MDAEVRAGKGSWLLSLLTMCLGLLVVTGFVGMQGFWRIFGITFTDFSHWEMSGFPFPSSFSESWIVLKHRRLIEHVPFEEAQLARLTCGWYSWRNQALNFAVLSLVLGMLGWTDASVRRGRITRLFVVAVILCGTAVMVSVLVGGYVADLVNKEVWRHGFRRGC